jgi:hypothetical protein
LLCEVSKERSKQGAKQARSEASKERSKQGAKQARSEASKESIWLADLAYLKRSKKSIRKIEKHKK